MPRGPSSWDDRLMGVLEAMRRLQAMSGRIPSEEHQHVRDVLLTQVHATLNAIEANRRRAA